MDYRFSIDKSDMDLHVIHRFLTQSYWSPGISVDAVENAVQNSLCFAVFNGAKQIGFGRFITDSTTFAYLADVFVLDEFQHRGIGKRMLSDAFALPQVQGLRRILLATSTAHTLYTRFGFTQLSKPSMIMEKVDSSLISTD